LGGSAVYNFLKLPSTSLLSATGGVNVSYKTNDMGLSANNPALLAPELNSQLNVAFNGVPGGIKAYALTGAWHNSKLNTTFGSHIYFVDYGTIEQADAAGNLSGDMRPVDYVVQVSAGRSYLEKWNYGATLKYIGSNYGQYRSSAIAVDFGVHYTDSANNFYAGLLAKNMGAQLTTYADEREDLPFDLQVGITKRLAKAPLGFSVTLQNMHQFDILYNDTTFNNENQYQSNDNFFNKLFNHFVIASHIYLGNNLEAAFGYNRLRRSDLSFGTGNGLTGFSLGLRAKFQKLQVLYSRSSYQKNIAYNQLGISLHLDKLFGLGKTL
jgi:hypothetical protein